MKYIGQAFKTILYHTPSRQPLKDILYQRTLQFPPYRNDKFLHLQLLNTLLVIEGTILTKMRLIAQSMLSSKQLRAVDAYQSSLIYW